MAKLNQKNELGKGIRALLGDINSEMGDLDELSISNNKVSSSVNLMPIEQIEVNPFQPRVHFDDVALTELSESIKIHGIIQPLTVRDLNKSGKFQLISGERRLRASHLAGLKEVPVYIRIANDQEALEMALIENIQREDLNAIEIGLNYQRLIDECEINHEELAIRVGKKRATISNYIRLLKLPPEIQIAVREDKISMGHARALAGIEHIDHMLSIYREVTNKNLSVRQTEQLVAQRLEVKSSTSKATKQSNPIHRKWQDSLSSNLSTKVTIKTSLNGTGSIVIPFHNEIELERLIEEINK